MKLCPLLTTAYRLDEDRQCLGESCALYEKCQKKDRKVLSEVIQIVILIVAFLVTVYVVKFRM
jgi:predicted nucleic acid-binding Zn ribbon protein